MKRLLLVTAVGLLLGGPVPAQRLLHHFENELSDDYGESVRIIGDIDDDGHADIAIRQLSFNRAEIRSGSSGEIIRSHSVFTNDARFGHAQTPLRDLDGDGFDDYAITALGDIVLPSSLHVFSGRTGTRLARLEEGGPNERFAYAVASGDVDGDGIDDLWVGHPKAEIWPFYQPGKIYVYSGSTFEKLFELIGQNGGLGAKIVAIDDVNDDGVVDFAATAVRDWEVIEILSGADGVRLRTIESGASSGVLFGSQMTTVPDLDGDGKRELLVSAASWDRASSDDDYGRVFVISAVTGATLMYWEGTLKREFFGDDVGWTEANRDPLPEIVIARRKPPSISVYALDGHELYRLAEPDLTRIGFSHSGDINADGAPDLVTSGAGYAKAYSGYCTDVAALASGCPGMGGVTPSLDVFGCSYPGETVTVAVREARGAASGALLIGSEASPFEVLGCELGVTPLFAVPFLAGGLEGKPGAGYADIPLRIPPGEQHVGRRVSAQAVIFDVGVPQGLAATNAVTLTTL